MNLELGGIPFELTRKAIKNINLRINREGHVKISAPLHCSDVEIHSFIHSKRDWIKHHALKLQSRAVQQNYQFIAGEQHFYLGEPHTIDFRLQTGSEKIVLDTPYIYFYIDECRSENEKNHLLQSWYRDQLRSMLPAMIKHWEPILDVTVKEWRIKKMKTRWGTCNPRAQRIWLNLELIKKPLKCLEYVLVHEMVHLLEPSHNQRFYQLMSKFMPEWKVYKNRLRDSVCQFN